MINVTGYPLQDVHLAISISPKIIFTCNKVISTIDFQKLPLSLVAR